MAYTGAYGNVLIDGLSQLILLIQASPMALNAQKLEVIEHWIEKSFFPLLIHGELMDMSRGRSISRENASSRMAALEALRGILRLSQVLPEANKNRIQGQLKSILAFHDKERMLVAYLATMTSICLNRFLLMRLLSSCRCQPTSLCFRIWIN